VRTTGQFSDEIVQYGDWEHAVAYFNAFEIRENLRQIFEFLQYKLFRSVTIVLGITGLTTIAKIFCVCLSCSRPAENRMHHFANGRPVAFCGRSYCGSVNQFAKRSVDWTFA